MAGRRKTFPRECATVPSRGDGVREERKVVVKNLYLTHGERFLAAKFQLSNGIRKRFLLQKTVAAAASEAGHRR